jgi:3-dehydroquinate synthase
MREIKIKASREYNVYINSGTSSVPFLFENHKVRKVFIITDENVYGLYPNFIDNLSKQTLDVMVIKPGEDS